MPNNLERQENLTDKQLQILESELNENRKNVGIAYLLWFFLGTLGIHKFYMNKKNMGGLYLLLGIFSWATIWMGIGLVTFIILGFLLIYDLFTIPGQIDKQQKELKEEIISRFENKNAEIENKTTKDVEE